MKDLLALSKSESEGPSDQLIIRLLLAVLFGTAVAVVRTIAQPRAKQEAGFRTTLVLLTVLTALVMSVVGDNIARAFGLAGVLAVVRFRTVVEDTRDSAFVIFSMAEGMAVGYGYLMSATGMGALVGAIFLASRSRLKGLAEMIAIAGVLYGAGFFALSFSNLLWIAWIIALVLGFSLMMQMASSNTIVQSLVEDQKRGRVLSLFVMARRGVESLGSLVFGAVASWVGTPGALMVGGAVCLAGMAIIALQPRAVV